MLSDEDKRRIEEEERYRAEVRSQASAPTTGDSAPTTKKKSSGCVQVLGVLAVVAALMFIVIVFATNSKPSGSKTGTSLTEDEPQVEVVLSHGLVCGKTQEDMYRIGGAAEQNDLMGVYRMTERGTALQLLKGTKVTTLMHDGKLVLVSIGSGVHSMTSCWAASSNVK